LTDAFSQLIRARSRLKTASDAFQARNDFLGVHAFDKAAHTLGVATATAVKLHIVNLAVDDFEFDDLATSALRIISVFHTI